MLAKGLAGFLMLAALTFTAGVVRAQDYKIADLHIGHPWARATPKGATIGAGYLTITNKGGEADRLVSITADVSRRVELHETRITQGMMQMRPLTEGVEIKPGETVEFKPESFHVMFVDLKQPLEKGRRLKARLNFAKAGPLEVEFAVEAAGKRPNTDRSGHSGH